MDTDMLRNPAAREFHGYAGDRPIHLAVLDDGRTVHVDRFKNDDDRYFIEVGQHGVAGRVYVPRSELLAMARDIIRELEG